MLDGWTDHPLVVVFRRKKLTSCLVWDRYAAAAVSDGLRGTIGNTTSLHIKEAAKRAAEIANALLIEPNCGWLGDKVGQRRMFALGTIDLIFLRLCFSICC